MQLAANEWKPGLGSTVDVCGGGMLLVFLSRLTPQERVRLVRLPRALLSRA